VIYPVGGRTGLVGVGLAGKEPRSVSLPESLDGRVIACEVREHGAALGLVNKKKKKKKKSLMRETPRLWEGDQGGYRRIGGSGFLASIGRTR